LDLHLTNAQATAEEQAAVDSELGTPQSGWEGGQRQAELDGHTASREHDTRSQRHRLLPVLHAIQNRIGWISPGALNYVAVRLDVAPAEVFGVASFYGMFALSPRPPVVAHVCDDIGCIAHGAEKLCAELDKKLGPAGSPCAGGRATWLRSQCLGLCERAPAALVTAAGTPAKERVLAPATVESLQALVKDALENRLPAEPDVLNPQLSVPQAGSTQLRLLQRVGKSDASSIDDYRRLGGYEALGKALELGPEGVIREISASHLLGRGARLFRRRRNGKHSTHSASFFKQTRTADTMSFATPMNQNQERLKTAF
jgi:NADH-quinone oxidoreductase subunit F